MAQMADVASMDGTRLTQDGRSVRVGRSLERVPPLYRGLATKVAAGLASPRQAIKAKCLDCACYVRAEVAECTAYACPLWTYRPYQPGDTEAEA